MNPHHTNTGNPIDFPGLGYEVTWVFRNEHQWSQTFDSARERDHWINRVGLVTHPDIVRVSIREGDFERDLKRVA